KPPLIRLMVGARDCSVLPSSNVRFGSKADICSAQRHVRFTPESGHYNADAECANQSFDLMCRVRFVTPLGAQYRCDLYSVVESGYRSQAGKERVRESGKAGIPGMYLVRPTVRLRRVARQRVSRIDEAEVVGWVVREVREPVLKQIDHLGHDLQSLVVVI